MLKSVIARGYIISSFLGLAVASTAPCDAQVSFDARPPREQAADRALRQALDSRISVRYHEERLGDIVRSLRQHLSINIVLDERALDGVGIIPGTLVTLELSDVTVESVLEAMLKQLELAWMVRHESLVITTPEETESNLGTRLYPVADLVLAEYEDAIYEEDQVLIDAIMAIVWPQSWDDVGGPGSIAYLPNVRALVCCQTRPVHEEIERLLTTLRKVKRVQGIADVQSAVGALQRDPRSEVERVDRDGASFGTAKSSRRGYTYQSDANWRLPRVHQ